MLRGKTWHRRSLGGVSRFPVRMLRGQDLAPATKVRSEDSPFECCGARPGTGDGRTEPAAKRDQRCPARTIALMPPAPIVPADVDFSDPGSPRSPLHDDCYHAAYGAFAQASHVF